jgi:hypothetical protein
VFWNGAGRPDQTLAGGTAATNNTTVSVSSDGTYSWLVEYAGDSTHTNAISTCNTEHFAVDFTDG